MTPPAGTAVLGVKRAAPAQAQRGKLAYTGSEATTALTATGLLLVAGGAALVATRPRAQAPPHRRLT